MLITHLKVRFFNLWEGLKITFFYYRSLHFFYIDTLFKLRYIGINPYRLACKKGFLYGETPLTTMDKIATQCRILSRDSFYDLGCGRGRNLFWLNYFVGCRTVGIECLNEFVTCGESLIRFLKTRNLSFNHCDILNCDFENASVIYLYGTSFSDEILLQLANKFKHLSSQTKIITVSFSLNEYMDAFDIKKSFKGKFPWGNADIYLQVPKSSS